MKGKIGRAKRRTLRVEMQSIHYLCYLIRIFCLSQTVNNSRKINLGTLRLPDGTGIILAGGGCGFGGGWGKNWEYE